MSRSDLQRRFSFIRSLFHVWLIFYGFQFASHSDGSSRLHRLRQCASLGRIRCYSLVPSQSSSRDFHAHSDDGGLASKYLQASSALMPNPSDRWRTSFTECCRDDSSWVDVASVQSGLWLGRHRSTCRPAGYSSFHRCCHSRQRLEKDQSFYCFRPTGRVGNSTAFEIRSRYGLHQPRRDHWSRAVPRVGTLSRASGSFKGESGGAQRMPLCGFQHLHTIRPPCSEINAGQSVDLSTGRQLQSHRHPRPSKLSGMVCLLEGLPGHPLHAQAPSAFTSATEVGGHISCHGRVLREHTQTQRRVPGSLAFNYAGGGPVQSRSLRTISQAAHQGLVRRKAAYEHRLRCLSTMGLRLCVCCKGHRLLEPPSHQTRTHLHCEGRQEHEPTEGREHQCFFGSSGSIGSSWVSQRSYSSKKKGLSRRKLSCQSFKEEARCNKGQPPQEMGNPLHHRPRWLGNLLPLCQRQDGRLRRSVPRWTKSSLPTLPWWTYQRCLPQPCEKDKGQGQGRQ